MSAPRTESGKRLLEHYAATPVLYAAARDTIVSIEEEAVMQATLDALETVSDVPLTPESQAAVDWARKRLFCDQCPHAWTSHTVGGMCDGGGTECWCVLSPPTGLEL